MNELHLEYLRETGNKACKDFLWEFYMAEKITKECYDEVEEVFTPEGLSDIHTPEYVHWLENRLA